jgi:microcystin-dependent protein
MSSTSFYFPPGAIMGFHPSCAGKMPQNWYLCDGTTQVDVAKYPALKDLLGPNNTTPNLSGMLPIGAGIFDPSNTQGSFNKYYISDEETPKQVYQAGEMYGEYGHRITVDQMPQHYHNSNYGTYCDWQNANPGPQGGSQYQDQLGCNNHTDHSYTFNTGYMGGSKAMLLSPPTYAVLYYLYAGEEGAAPL